MSKHRWSKQYEAAIRSFQEHLKLAEDGTFFLDVSDGRSMGIDPVVFAELTASLERTNSMIRNGEISASDAAFI